MFIYNALITLYLARRYTQIIVSRPHLFLGEKLLFFSVAWEKTKHFESQKIPVNKEDSSAAIWRR